AQHISRQRHALREVTPKRGDGLVACVVSPQILDRYFHFSPPRLLSNPRFTAANSVRSSIWYVICFDLPIAAETWANVNSPDAQASATSRRSAISSSEIMSLRP